MVYLPHDQAFLVTGMATTRFLSVSFTRLIVSASHLLLTGKPVPPDRSGSSEASASFSCISYSFPSSQNIKSDVPCQGDFTRHTHNCH